METMEKNDAMKSNQACSCGCDNAVERNQAGAVEKTDVQRQAPRRAYAPAVDIIESEAGVRLVVDVPGVPEGAVDLTIEKNVLTLAAVPADGVIAGKKLEFSEYGTGEYRRSFILSEDIDRDGISAGLKNGVLRIDLPKRAPVTKKISVGS